MARWGTARLVPDGRAKETQRIRNGALTSGNGLEGSGWVRYVIVGSGVVRWATELRPLEIAV